MRLPTLQLPRYGLGKRLALLLLALYTSPMPAADLMQQPAKVMAAKQSKQPRSPKWQAKWIWQTSSPWMVFNAGKQALEFKDILPSEKNTHLYFRKSFELTSEVRTAPAYITADSRYRLYVNGQFVGRGPARSYPRFQYYDVYDIAKYLKPGKKIIAAVVHFYGEATAWYMPGKAGVLSVGSGPKAVPGKGGLLFQCDVETAEGKRITVGTDETWKIRQAEAWKQEMPRVNFSLGFIEVFDSRKDIANWNRIELNDSDWKQALPYASWSDAVAPIEPFTNLLPRDIPFLLEKPLSAERIVEVGEVSDAAGEVPADQMMREEITPLSQATIQNAQAILVADGKSASVQAPLGKSVSVVLDFGRTVTGYSHLEIEGVEGATVDIGVSERLSKNKERYFKGPFASEMPGQRTGILFNPGHGKQVDRYIARDGKQVWETGDIKGFRYMQVTFRNITRPLKVDAISLNFTSYPVERRGRFESSSARLNQIWETGAYTLQMCMTDAYVDCPSREQRQWVGDAYVEAMINYAAFGDPRLTAKLLRQTAQSQQSDGMTMMYAPGDHDVLATTIVDYSLQWIMTAHEYYMYTGDAGLVKEMYPHVRLAVDWFERHTDENGLLGRIPHWVFIDWAHVDKRGEITALNALLYKALKDAAVLAGTSAAPVDQARFEKLAERVKSSLNERMWDSRRGIYVDCYVDDGPCRRVSQQTNSAMILFDIAPAERWTGIIDYITDAKRVRLRQTELNGDVISGGTFDEETDVVMAQPFFSYFLHRALAKVRATDRLLARIEERWGAMLDAGATTWWEEWMQRPDSSECHAWSGSPTFDLSTEVLGVRPTSPGFSAFIVEPQTAGLSYAKGIFPTVKGDIRVRWTAKAGNFTLSVTSPPQTKMELVLPVKMNSRVLVNNVVVWEASRFRENSIGVADARWDGRAVRLKIERDGEFKAEATLF
jgi:alpha-L-rhamnosidase